MSAGIGPGTWMVCVDNSPRYRQGEIERRALQQLRIGAAYCCKGGAPNDGHPVFVGITAAWEHKGFGWFLERFRPYQGPEQSSLVKQVDVPASDKVLI